MNYKGFFNKGVISSSFLSRKEHFQLKKKTDSNEFVCSRLGLFFGKNVTLCSCRSKHLSNVILKSTLKTILYDKCKESASTQDVHPHLSYTLPKLKNSLKIVAKPYVNYLWSPKKSPKKLNVLAQSGLLDQAESDFIFKNTNSATLADNVPSVNVSGNKDGDSPSASMTRHPDGLTQYPIGVKGLPSRSKINQRAASQEKEGAPSFSEQPKGVSPTSIEKRPTFPFTAIVGQEEMKLALLLNVIDPKIGGVMIMGDRGTGKSTTVRALVDLLPDIQVVENDPFNSHPSDAELMSQNVREQVLQGKELKVVSKKTAMIDLPLGATEDRVCGTIDIEKALSEGVKAFEPGLLAKANRGILYVDEVNLLDDHLVDILLDSAASGWNTVEREGISINHPARFILVGSGNPEEGELRPQLLDRFGMHAQIGTVREAELRVKIVEERAKFDQSPIEFLNGHAEKQRQLAEKIVAARHLLGAVKIDYDLRVKISQICGQLNVDGLRGDIVTNRASQALAAFEARTIVTPKDIFRVIPFCLRHRLRKDPLESIDSGDRVRETFKQVFGYFSE